MEDSKFFRYLWRFNALAIALAALLGIFILLVVGYFFLKDVTGTRHDREIVNVDPESEIQESYRLGRLSRISGSGSVVIPLHVDQQYSARYSSSNSTSATRNLLFSNLQLRNNHWLLSSNEKLIVEYRFLSASNGWDESKNVLAILYEIIESDTNGDGRLTLNDKTTLALSSPQGTGLKEVLKDIDGVLGYEVLNEKQIALVFKRKEQGHIAYVSMEDFSVLDEIPLPRAGK